MNSSILDLQSAIDKLVGTKESSNAFKEVVDACSELYNCFDGVNKDLQNGWLTCAKVYSEINNAIVSTLTGIHIEIENYTNEVYQEELTATKVLEETNRASEEVLKELQELELSN